jgi:hypothetical protein
MATQYLERKDVPQVVLNAFPDYNGKKFRLSVCDSVDLHNAYWDGGSRTEYRAVKLDTGEISSANPQITNPFRVPSAPSVEIPARTVIVAHIIFCGKDVGLEIFARAEDVAPMLPPVCELTEDQKIVLEYTRSRKPSYNGISNYRFHEARSYTGITSERWEQAKAEMITSGHLDKRGAITPKGKNAITKERE